MSFSPVTFSGTASGASGTQSTSGTFTAIITGNPDGTVSGTWSFSGTYRDAYVYGTSGVETASGTLTGTGGTTGPWTITLQGGGIQSEGLTLTYANGQYSLAVNAGYPIDYTVNLGYDGLVTYHDVFHFSAQLAAAGTGPGGGTAVFAGTRASYSVAHAGAGLTVTSAADGTHQENGVTRLQFSDMSINLTVGDIAHTITTAQLNSIVELYIAYLNRVPDADGMAFWIGQLKAGQGLDAIGQHFYEAAVQFGNLTGYTATMSNADFVGVVYHNVLGRSQPDAEGLAFWSNALASGAATRGTLVASMLQSAHTFKGDAQFGFVADLLDNKIAVGKLFAINDGLVFNTSDASITQGMAIAAAVTPTSTAAAVGLIGVTDGFSVF
jgi:hypothetical protein